MRENLSINSLIIALPLGFKSLPASLFEREEFPSLAKRGRGDLETV
jgi:hypothetical protein